MPSLSLGLVHKVNFSQHKVQAMKTTYPPQKTLDKFQLETHSWRGKTFSSDRETHQHTHTHTHTLYIYIYSWHWSNLLKQQGQRPHIHFTTEQLYTSSPCAEGTLDIADLALQQTRSQSPDRCTTPLQ